MNEGGRVIKEVRWKKQRVVFIQWGKQIDDVFPVIMSRTELFKFTVGCYIYWDMAIS